MLLEVVFSLPFGPDVGCVACQKAGPREVAALGDSKPSSCGNSRARLKCGKPNKPPPIACQKRVGLYTSSIFWKVHPSSLIPTPGMPDFVLVLGPFRVPLAPILPGMVNWEKAAELRSSGIFG